MLDIQAIKKRCDDAAPGPWEYVPGAKALALTSSRYITTGRDGAIYVLDTPNRSSNARFVAYAREDIPALLAEVTRLRTALEKTAAALDRYEMDSLAHVLRMVANGQMERLPIPFDPEMPTNPQ